jgi:dTDP-4-dehydrorhamnose reductase
MKTLVIGGSGFVGYYIKKYFDCQGTSLTGKEGCQKLDITSERDIGEFIGKNRPELIINSAAMANVELCEKESNKSMLVNGQAVEWLARSAQENNAKFVQISTDYVFDGEKGDYNELDKPNPINQYGKSKLVGEENALRHDAIVLRIEMPYGINFAKNKNTFFESALNNLSNDKEVNAAIDQIISPTYVEDVPKAIETLITNSRTGVFHLASKEKLSRYDFVTQIARTFELNADLIKKVSLDDFKFDAKRPKKTSLNTDKISEIFTIDSLNRNLSKIKDMYKT